MEERREWKGGAGKQMGRERRYDQGRIEREREEK